MKGALIMIGVLWAVSIVFTALLIIGVLPREDDSRIARMVIWFFPFSAVFFPIALSFVPFGYSQVDGGISFHAPVRTRTVLFKDVEGVILYKHKLKNGYQERLLLVAGGKNHFVIGDATDFEELRDYVLAGVDPSLVVDKREPAEAS